MAKQAHLQAILSAVDRLSPVLGRITGAAMRTKLGLGVLNTVNFSVAQRKLGMLQKTFRDVGSSSRNVLSGLGLPASVSLGALGFGFVAAGRGALEYAGALQDAADNTGMAIGALQEYQTAFEAAGVSSEDFTTAVSKLNKGIADAAAGKDKGLASLMTRLRIPLRDAKGALRGVEQVLPELSDAFAKNTNPALRTRMAMELFGKSGAKLIAIMMKGGASLAEARGEAQRLGAVLSDQATGGLDDVGDAFGVLNRQVKVQTAEAFGVAAPAILAATKGLQEWIARNKDLILQRLSGYITRVADAFRGWVESGGIERLAAGLERLVDGTVNFVRSVGGMRNLLIGMGALLLAGPVSALVSLGAAVARVALVALPMLGKAMLLVGRIFLLNPIGLVVTAIAGAAYLIYRNWSTVGPFFARMWDGIKGSAMTAWNVLRFLFSWTPLGIVVNNWGAITTYLGELWTSITGAVTGGLDAVGKQLSDWDPLHWVREAWDPVLSFLGEVWDQVSVIVGPMLRLVGAGANAFGRALGSVATVAEQQFGPNSQQQYGPRFGTPTPLVSAGAMQGAARVQGDMRVRFENAPPGMRVDPGTTTSPGLGFNPDVGYRSMGSIG